MNKRNFVVLDACRKEHHTNQRYLASSTGLSLGSVNKALKELESAGLVSNGEITPKGYESLHPYKVETQSLWQQAFPAALRPFPTRSRKDCSKFEAKS